MNVKIDYSEFYWGKYKESKIEKPVVPEKKKESKNGTKRGVLAILICFFLTLAGVNYASEINVLINSGAVNGKEEFYVVQCANVGSISMAELIAGSVRMSGAGGYVITDDGYRVILGAYSTEAEAVSVAKKNGGEIYVLSAEPKSRGEGLNYAKRAFDMLNELVVKFETGELNKKDVSVRIREIATEVRKYGATVKGETTAEVFLKAETERIAGKLLELAENPTPENLRYLTVDLAKGYTDLIKNYFR